jgi:hypothetical protein
MSRRSLRPQLNQIRGWVRQGRTDAWIAHQLDVTVQQIQAFKREQDLEADGDGGTPVDEVDLRAEDDAAIAAELEEEAKRRAEEEARAAEEAAARAAEAEAEADEEEEKPAKRARRTRGGRSRRRTVARPLEGTFDHGEEGYGLWLDPAVQDDPVYAEHWAGHRPVEITIEEDQIVIRRAGGGEDDDEDCGAGLLIERDPAAAREVGGRAQVAGEGGVGDRAGVPGVRLLGRRGDGEVGGPACALVVQVGELGGREGAPEPPAQVILDRARHALERATLLGRSIV